MELIYRIELEGQIPVTGRTEAAGEIHIVHPLHGRIKKITAAVTVPIAESEKILMNGYQTWTHTPERGRNDKIRGLTHLPKLGVRYFGLDRYGDYFFRDYPQKAGITHGESYCYFRRGETFRLAASLDERPGYTLFTYDANAQVLYMERDCAGVIANGDLHAFDLYFASGTEDQVFDGWFKAMGVKPRTEKRIAGYTSWYNRYEDINEESIRTDLTGCAGVLQPGDLFQIDDGWEPHVGDWLIPDGKKFPNGIKTIVDDIHARGFTAGLWLAPFVCCRGSRIYREHPDWLLKHEGKSWYCGCNWGGFYSLDIDNAEFVAYLRESFRRVFDEWGFDLVKLDFLYGAAPFGDEHESRAGRMIRAMELLRDICGDKLILGCGVPVMPAFGLVDYCRISCDVGLDWNNNIIMRQTCSESVSTSRAICNTVFRRQLNGRAYLSDPDVFFLRENNIKLTDDEKYLLSTVNSLFGGVLLCSDNMGEYSPEAKKIYARLLKNRDAKNIRVDNDGPETLISYELEGKTQLISYRP